jgi:transcriptional regulator with XRE-family HTH domain
MPFRETASERGARRGRRLVGRTAEGLANARRSSGLSLREVARKLGVGHARVARAERGDRSALTIDFASRYAAIVGYELGVTLHPDGEPVRDKAHLALIARLRARLAPGVRVRTEVPIPIAGDRRSADLVLGVESLDILVEAETRLDDIQATERNIAGKQRDLAAERVVLLVADTRHNREVIRGVPELRARFPVDTRTCLAALKEGLDPGGDSLVIL